MMPFVINQSVVDRQTYNLAPGPLGSSPSCTVCGSAAALRIASIKAERGRLFLTKPRDTGFDSAQTVVLCTKCWATWLMWRARMGFDLHTHDSSAACEPDCLARKGGRRNQMLAQLSTLSSRESLFFITKAVDGIPRVNGSHVIMAQRAAKFLFRSPRMQGYYESLLSATEAQRLFVEAAAWQEQIGVSRAYTDKVSIVVEAFKSWYVAPKGVVSMPAPGDESIGLHCVMLTHYSDSGTTLGFINSWERQWGDRGFGTMPFEYLERYFHDAFVVRVARFGPTEWKFYGARDTSHRELRRRLLIENPRWRRKLRVARGDSWELCIYDTMSPATDEPVKCVEIANGFGLKMGWTFCRLCSTSSERALEVTELFVWPTFRRMGIGRLLEDVVLAYGGMWECSEIRLMLNEADAVLGPPRSAARHFAQALGYKWKWREEMGPRRPGTALKQI